MLMRLPAGAMAAAFVVDIVVEYYRIAKQYSMLFYASNSRGESRDFIISIGNIPRSIYATDVRKTTVDEDSTDVGVCRVQYYTTVVYGGIPKW